MSVDQSSETGTIFQSPIPLIMRIRNLIFGEEKPDSYTLFTFYLNLFIWFLFMFWSLASYLTISFKDVIQTEKNIEIEKVIEQRGELLGFEPHQFLDRLLTTQSIGIICWTIVFIGIVLLYRKREQFIYFILGGVIFYSGMLIFYLSFKYFTEDVTLFDKIALLAILSSSIMYFFLLRKEREGGSINFFEDESDE